MSDIPFIVWWGSFISRITYNTTTEFFLLYNLLHKTKYSTKIQNVIKKRKLESLPMKDVLQMSKFINNKIGNVHNFFKEDKNEMLKDAYKQYVVNNNVMIFKIQNSKDFTCYITADKSINKIIISFRGTRSLLNIETDLSLSTLTNKYGTFLKSAYVIEKNEKLLIHSCLRYLLKTFINKPELIIVGHSLGGGYATLFSYLFLSNVKKDDILYSFVNNMICITYGSIKIMNENAKNKMNDFIKEKKIVYMRYATQNDPAPYYPPLKKMYHPGLEDNFYHCNNTFNTIKEVENIFFSLTSKKHIDDVNYFKLKCNLDTNKDNYHPLYHTIQYYIDYTSVLYNYKILNKLKKNEVELTLINNGRQIEKNQSIYNIHESSIKNEDDLIRLISS